MDKTAAAIMRTTVFKVKEQDTIGDVLEKFVMHRISGVPVVNEFNELVGYISDGDIMRFIGRRPDMTLDFFYTSILISAQEEFGERVQHLKTMNVMKIAKKNVIKVQENSLIEDVAAILGRKKIKKVPVERNGVLAGIISRGDVIRHIYRQYFASEADQS